MIFILCIFLLNPLVNMFTAAAKEKSVNLNLETVLEFDNKNLDNDVEIIDSVRNFLSKVRSILDKSKDYRRNFNKDNVKFTDFLENVFRLFMTYSDDELEELSVVIDEEMRKYHYKGCKFYELLQNNQFRTFISDMLEGMKRTRARKIRKLLHRSVKKLEEREFNEREMEFVQYINSLYRADAKETMYNVLKSFEQFSKSKRRTHANLVQVIRNCFRSIIFDHYSKLNANARKDLRIKIGNYFAEITPKRNKESSKSNESLAEIESDSETTKGVRKRSNATTPVDVNRDLEGEKRKMPQRFISLYAEEIPTTTSSKPKSKKISKKNIKQRARSHKHGKVGKQKVPDFRQETYLERLHERRPKTVMVVREDRPLREILTEHNAIIRVMSSHAPAHIDTKKKKHRTQRKRKHSRSKSKHQRMSKMNPRAKNVKEEETTAGYAVTGSRGLYSERKQLGNTGLSIESFENNVLAGHYLYRKQNKNDDFNKRSSLRKKEKNERASGYRKSDISALGGKLKKHTKDHARRHNIKKYKNAKIENKEFKKKSHFRAETVDEKIDTTNPSYVSDDYIINKIHNLEKQLENVINKMEDHTEKETNSTRSFKNSITITTTTAPPFNTVNRAQIYENIDTTLKHPIIPFWKGTPKTIRVYSSSSSSSCSSEESGRNKDPVSKRASTPVSKTVFTTSNLTEPVTQKVIKSSNIAKTSNTDRASVNDATVTVTATKPTDYTPNYRSNSSTFTYAPKKTIISDIADDFMEKMYSRKSVVIADNLDIHDNDNVSNAKDIKPDKEKRILKGPYSNTYVEFETKNKISTQKDGRKVINDKYVISTNEYNNQKSTKTTIKPTKKDPISTVKNNESDNKSKTKIVNKGEFTAKSSQITVVKANKTITTTSTNITLPTKSRLQLNSSITNVTKSDLDKTKTSKVNATTATITTVSIANQTSSQIAPTRLSLRLSFSNATMNIFQSTTSSNSVKKSRRELNYLSPVNENNPFDKEVHSEEVYLKNRDMDATLYNWA